MSTGARHINAESPADESGALISVRGLSHRYPGMARPALEDVDFEVPRGALAGLIGPNGAGKSTLLAILTGVTRMQAGDIRIAGRAPGDGGWLRSASSLVPQACAFYPALTGRENLHFFAGIHGLAARERRDRLAECVSIAGLEEVLERPAATYSGGLQRRLNLALGLINRPEILYLDEPTVGVDAESRGCIVEAIARLRRGGTTIVYTSHYMEEVEQLCDRLTVIDRGRTVAAGPTDALLERFGGTAMRIHLRQAPTPALQDWLAGWSAQWLDERTVRLAIADAAAAAVVLQGLDERGAVAERVRYGVERLEDVYRRLLGAPEAA